MYKEKEPDTIVNQHTEDDILLLGIVANCKKLNVRERPTVHAPVVCEIVCQTELMIDEKESTEEFYKVCTAAGVEGFCMKKFIAIQP